MEDDYVSDPRLFNSWMPTPARVGTYANSTDIAMTPSSDGTSWTSSTPTTWVFKKPITEFDDDIAEMQRIDGTSPAVDDNIYTIPPGVITISGGGGGGGAGTTVGGSGLFTINSSSLSMRISDV